MTAADDTPAWEKTTDPWVVWKRCKKGQAEAALARLTTTAPTYFRGATLESGRSSALPFYTTHRLVELSVVRDFGTERVYALDGPERTLWLDGSSEAIHETNDAESLELVEADVPDYVRYFFYFIRGDEGAFVLIETSDEVRSRSAAVDSADDTTDGTDNVPALSLESAQTKARVPITRGLDDEGRWLVDVTVAYEDVLFESTVAVSAGGEIEMITDDPLGSLRGLSTPECPYLGLLPWLDEPTLTEPPGAELMTDRAVTKAVVEILLEDAIGEMNQQVRAGDALLHHFNSQTHTPQPIDQLTRLVAASKAMVIIESDIPFIEDVVAELVDPTDTGGWAVRARAVEGDDLRCQISVNDSGKLFLLSFHTYRSLFDAERVAHDLSLSGGAVLIGCSRADDVPESLRRTTDLVITLPRIDRGRFERIFGQVFRGEPPAGWDAPNADWIRYLVPDDFHTPRRLGLFADDALAMLRDRVQARLSQVTPDVGPGMERLHGMGEARQVAEDLIEDIRAAQSGRIPWSAVDRGLLLIGAPGTGKTTLARAIAKECGVKFVSASAAGWQAAGALDAHLRAMRADFAAARRYAPTILFIDEIDSIGNRETFEGANAIYQTEVVNALLAEIQGIDTTGSVIVIGATNHVEKVDPALRRAGRLDQVVEIPLPSIDGLEQIFDYYLAEFRSDGGELASDVDAHALAEMSFGLTAADVEFFVRGGARRARRENRPTTQADLMAEVTRRPRREDSAPRLTGAEMHRVAVHEAGHAVARLTSSTRGADLTYASIIPRLDGTLGFTASVPTNTRVLTRTTMIERLETLLGGRAAEEVVFGADDIGAGAGGPDTGSDLSVATRFATLIVCQSGLGEDGLLRWTTEPTGDQLAKIDAVMTEAYRSIRTRLQTQRPLLDRVAAALQQRQELSGRELRELATSTDSASPPT